MCSLQSQADEQLHATVVVREELCFGKEYGLRSPGRQRALGAHKSYRAPASVSQSLAQLIGDARTCSKIDCATRDREAPLNDELRAGALDGPPSMAGPEFNRPTRRHGEPEVCPDHDGLRAARMCADSYPNIGPGRLGQRLVRRKGERKQYYGTTAQKPHAAT
jgi:hypothetical protein